MKNTLVQILIFCCVTICSSVSAQQSDELMQAENLIQTHDYQKALILLDQAIIQKPTRFGMSEVHYLQSQAYLGLEDLSKASYYNQQSLSIRNNLQYEFIAENYFLFGMIEMKKGDMEKALASFFKAIELPYESIEFGGLLYANIALIYYRQKDFDNVVKYYKIAMNTFFTAFEEANQLDLNNYRIRRNQLYYNNFFVGYL